MRHIAVMLTFFILVSCNEEEPIPNYLNQEITVGDTENASYWRDLNDSSLFPVNDYHNTALITTYIDTDGDDIPELSMVAATIRETYPVNNPGTIASGPIYRTYPELRIEFLDKDSQWQIAVEEKGIQRIAAFTTLNLATLSYANVIEFHVISAGYTNLPPVIADSQTNGWWQTENSSFLLIRKNEETISATAIKLSVEKYHNCIIHQVTTFDLE